MITSPLDLKRHLTAPGQGMDAVPFLDLCLIGLFLILLGSRFISAPGVGVEVPEASDAVLSGARTVGLVTVLTVRENNMILFNGDIVGPETLPRALKEYVRENHLQKGVLLVKVDKNVEVRSLLKILDFARQSGFGKVQLAAEKKKKRVDFLSSKE